MAHYEYANSVIDNAKKKVIRKAFEIHTPKIALANGIGLWRVRRFLKERAQLLIELVG